MRGIYVHHKKKAAYPEGVAAFGECIGRRPIASRARSEHARPTPIEIICLLRILLLQQQVPRILLLLQQVLRILLLLQQERPLQELRRPVL